MKSIRTRCAKLVKVIGLLENNKCSGIVLFQKSIDELSFLRTQESIFL